jgi:hypothetical protein
VETAPGGVAAGVGQGKNGKGPAMSDGANLRSQEACHRLSPRIGLPEGRSSKPGTAEAE